MKAIIILCVLLGLLMFGLIVATATPNDKEQYEAYERWKQRKLKKEMCENAQSICNHECESCAWWAERGKRNE